MQEFISLITQGSVFAFLLLFARVLSFLVFMPIFGHNGVSPTIRVAIAFYVSLVLYSLVDSSVVNINNFNENLFLLALVSEITLGLVASLFFQIVFAGVEIVGDLIGFATNLTMANIFDPTTNINQGVVSKLLYMIAALVYFQTGMYKITILLLASSVGDIQIGSFNIFDYNGIDIAIREIKAMIEFAFAFALPLFFVSFVLDIYYSYGTKSMQSFSPFVLTFQIKFALVFAFLIFGMQVFISSFVNYFFNKFG